jgi:hypothetical protein
MFSEHCSEHSGSTKGDAVCHIISDDCLAFRSRSACAFHACHVAPCCNSESSRNFFSGLVLAAASAGRGVCRPSRLNATFSVKREGHGMMRPRDMHFLMIVMRPRLTGSGFLCDQKPLLRQKLEKKWFRALKWHLLFI